MRSIPLRWRCSLAAVLALALVLHLSFAVNATSDGRVTIADLRAARTRQSASLEMVSIADSSRAAPPSPPIASATADIIHNRAISDIGATAADRREEAPHDAESAFPPPPPPKIRLRRSASEDIALAKPAASEQLTMPIRTAPFPVVMLAHARPGRLNVTLTSLLGVRGLDRSCVVGRSRKSTSTF